MNFWVFLAVALVAGIIDNMWLNWLLLRRKK